MIQRELHRLLTPFLVVLLTGSPALQAQPEEPDELPDSIFGLGWLDQTQALSSSKADALARQLDRYFGVERSDLEAAYSSLRLITESSWVQHDGNDLRLRLRGTLHLPRMNERLSLIFSEDQGEGATYYDPNLNLAEPRSTRVNLEVNLRERERYRFDFRVGLRSNLKLRSSMRYRYEQSFSEKLLGRLSETVYFIDGTGFGAFSQLQFDRTLSESSLLRWSTEFRTQEDLPGNEWSTALQYNVLSKNSGGISYFVGMAGNSAHPDIDMYQTGFRLRRNIARPWLFWEISPGYRWEKPLLQASYTGSLFTVLRLEMAIGHYQ